MKDGKHVVLYIDDDPDFRLSTRTILEANGYEMVEACSAEEGLRVYKESAPDAVIVDLMMEEVDAGVNFVKDIRLSGNTAPIFMLSNVGDTLTQSTDYNELGLAGVFQKPLEADHLLKILAAKLA